MGRVWIGVVVGCLLVAGCSARDLPAPAAPVELTAAPTASPTAPPTAAVTGVFAALAGASSAEIFVLDPAGRSNLEDSNSEDSNSQDEGYFHRQQILDQGPLPLNELPQLLGVLGEGVAEGGAPARCFNPRHGVRVKLADRTVDLVICFECWQIYEFDSTEEERTNHLTSDAPTAAVNAIFRRAGLTPLERS